jgi:hypothetical protein
MRNLLVQGCSADSSAQVIKANDDLTQEHHQFFLYQMLRGLKFVHSGAEAVLSAPTAT